MANYIYKEYDTYMVRLRIPKDVKGYFKKSTFCQSLKTTDKRLAKRLAAPLVANWKDMIAKARGDDNSMKGLVIESLRREWEFATDEQREAVEMYTLENHNPSEYKTVTGSLRPLAPMIDSFIKSKEDEQLTKNVIKQLESRLRYLNKTFENVQEINLESLRDWLGTLEVGNQTKTKYAASVIAMLDYHAVDTVALSKITFRTAKKAAAKVEKRRACTPKEFRELLGATKSQAQKDIMLIAAYTGMRVEEAASLRTENVDLSKGVLRVVDGKTAASNRSIPISNQIAGLLKSRMGEEYVFPELKLSEATGRRGNSVSVRFTQARKKLGLPNTIVFHSLRKMFITCLHEERVAVDVIKRLVGHADQDITTGLYSDAGLWPEMVSAIEKVAYP